MIKKGEQMLIINDESLFPVRFNKRVVLGNNTTDYGQEGAPYAAVGRYAPGTLAIPVFNVTSAVLGSGDNAEQMVITGLNNNINAIQVTRAVKFAPADPIKSVAAACVLSTTTLPSTASAQVDISVKLSMQLTDVSHAEYNTVFSDGILNKYYTLSFGVGESLTGTTLLTQLAQQIRNIQMRPQAENASMNPDLAYNVYGAATINGAAASAYLNIAPPYEQGMVIKNVECSYITFIDDRGKVYDPVTDTESDATVALATRVFTYASSTSLPAEFTAGKITRLGFYGRGVYDRLKMLIPQTPSKVGMFMNEDSFSSQQFIKGAKYVSYLFSMNVFSQTNNPEGTLNNTTTGNFDFCVYVNLGNCISTIKKLDTFFLSLNATKRPVGAKTVGMGTAYEALFPLKDVPVKYITYDPATGFDTTVAITGTSTLQNLGHTS